MFKYNRILCAQYLIGDNNNSNKMYTAANTHMRIARSIFYCGLSAVENRGGAQTTYTVFRANFRSFETLRRGHVKIIRRLVAATPL